MIEIRSLVKKRGNQIILDQLNLTLNRGEMGVLVGASGSGKTTLLRCLAGLEPYDQGEILYEAQVCNHIRPLGFVFQNLGLFPHLTVRENIEVVLTEKKNRVVLVQEVLELCSLTDIQHRRPDQISGGEKQRVALARALAPKPSLILLDEPFSSLDAHLRADVRFKMKDILKKAQQTSLMVTHDLAEALGMGDQVGLLYQGKILQWGSPQEVYQSPQSTQVAEFFGACTFVPQTDSNVFQLIRSENIRPSSEGRGTRLKVQSQIFQGASHEIRLINKNGLVFHYRASMHEHYLVGQEYDFEFICTDPIFFDQHHQRMKS